MNDRGRVSKIRLPHICKDDNCKGKFKITTFKNDSLVGNQLKAIGVTPTAQKCDITHFLDKTA